MLMRAAAAVSLASAGTLHAVPLNWKPFITESTTISAHTPSAMPIIDTAELMPMKRLRRLARV